MLINDIEVDPMKKDALKSCPRPLTSSDVKSFLGSTGYYRRFGEGFSYIASLMMNLTQKKTKFELLEDCEKIIQEFKERNNSTLVLTL